MWLKSKKCWEILQKATLNIYILNFQNIKKHYQNLLDIQKQPPRGFRRKRCSENMQQIYRRIPMPRCDFNKVASNFIEVALRRGCSPVNLLHIFGTPVSENTSGRLFLDISDDITTLLYYRFVY